MACTSCAGLFRMPVGGAVIGVLTVLTAPLLWPAATQLYWSPVDLLLAGDDLQWLTDAYYK